MLGRNWKPSGSVEGSPCGMGTLSVQMFLCPTGAVRTLAEEHNWGFLPWQKKVLWPPDLQSEACCSLCQIYVWCLSEECLLPVLLQIKSSTSRLLSFTHSSHSALIEMLNLPLQVINYRLKSSCPIKEDVKTPDTLIRYDLHQNLTKLFPAPPKAIYFYNYLPIYL